MSKKFKVKKICLPSCSVYFGVYDGEGEIESVFRKEYGARIRCKELNEGE